MILKSNPTECETYLESLLSTRPPPPHTKAAMSTGILNLIKIKGLLSNVSLKAKQNINKDTKVLSLMVQSLTCYRQQLYFEFLESLL